MILRLIGDFGIVYSLYSMLALHTLFAFIDFMPLRYSGYALDVLLFAVYFRFFALKQYGPIAVVITLFLYSSDEVFASYLGSLFSWSVSVTLFPTMICVVCLGYLIFTKRIQFRKVSLLTVFYALVYTTIVIISWRVWNSPLEAPIGYGSWLLVLDSVLEFK